MKNTKKGFTLVELLVVIAILAILASVAVVGYTAFLDKANDSATKSEAHQIKTAVEASLMVNDHVVVVTIADDDDDATAGDQTAYIVVAKNGTASKVTNLQTLTGDVEDISANFADFADELDVDGTTLTYTNNGYVVDVLAGTSEKE